MRRAQVDGPSQPVRNLCQNPRWEKWAGTQSIVRQNLCINPRGINTFLHYSGAGAQTITPNITISAHPLGITKATRYSFSSSASNPGLNILSPVLASTVYTMSAWIYIESLPDVPGAGGFAENGVLSGANYANTVGVWQKIVWTRTTTANPGPNFGIRHSGLSGGTGTGSILVTGIMIDTMAVETPFFDGSSAASGDFTYGWGGASNNAPSREYGPAAALVNTTGSAYRAAYQSTDLPSGHIRFLRMITYTSGVPVAVNPTDVEIPSGVPRTDLMWIRSNRTMAVSMRYRNASGSMVVAAPAVSLVAGQWQLYRNFASPAGADDMALGPLATTAIQAGDTIDIGPRMTVLGEYFGDIIHGASPFSKWDGTPDQSVSVGYPPQFRDLAGKPVIDLTTGQSVATNVVDGFAARTFYFVYEAFGNTASYNGWASYGIAGSKGFLLQTAAGGSNSMANRFDFPGGSFNGGLVFSQARTSRRHVLAVAFNQGMTSIAGCTDGGSDVVQVLNPGTTGWDDGRANCTTSAEGRGLRTLVFWGEHDRATRIAMSRYLGNKYGAYVA